MTWEGDKPTQQFLSYDSANSKFYILMQASHHTIANLQTLAIYNNLRLSELNWPIGCGVIARGSEFSYWIWSCSIKEWIGQLGVDLLHPRVIWHSGCGVTASIGA